MVRLAVVCLALLLSACQRAEPDLIVFAVATAPTVLDPRLASDAASERVNALLYDRLVDLDAHGLPVPAMARWEQLGPRHYRVQLRPERRSFPDGESPLAADVAATYRSVLDPGLGSPHASALGHVDRIDVLDDTTLDFHLERPDPRFPGRLTVGIAAAEDLGVRDPERPAKGSGPFVFERWREDGGLVLKRRSDGQRVAFSPVPDPTMRALKLLHGEAHLLQNDLPPELYDYLSRQAGIDVAQMPGITFAYLGFNLSDAVVGQREIREAIAHAVDRDAIVEHLFGGRAEMAESVLRPSHWAGTGDLPPYRHDPARARELLRAAGYGEDRPLEISYKTSTDPFRVRIAHVLQQQLAQVGIRLRVSSFDWGTFFGDIKAGHFQMYSLAWVGVNTPDILRYAFHSDSLAPRGANRGRYLSPVVDSLVDRAEQAGDGDAAGLFRATQWQVHHDLVYLPLWYEANVTASRGVEGYRPGFDGSYLALEEVRFVRR